MFMSCEWHGRLTNHRPTCVGAKDHFGSSTDYGRVSIVARRGEVGIEGRGGSKIVITRSFFDPHFPRFSSPLPPSPPGSDPARLPHSVPPSDYPAAAPSSSLSIDFLILMRTSERESEKWQRRSEFSNPHIIPNTGSVNGKAIAAELG